MPPKGKDKQVEKHFDAPATKFTHGKKQQQQPYTPGKTQFQNPDGTPIASHRDSTPYTPIIYQGRQDGTLLRDNMGSPIQAKSTPPPVPQTPTPNTYVLTGPALEAVWDMPYDKRFHSGPKTPGKPLTLNTLAYSAYLQALTPVVIWEGSFRGPANDNVKLVA
ncbi:hypothetical protein Q9L58_010763, partial [Maublancomyces gigas]